MLNSPLSPTAIAWFSLTAIVIGGIVRLLKSDTPLPTVPPRLRPWLALGLGLLAGVLQAVTTGTPWLQALGSGFSAAVTAITGHELVVESLRGGVEPFAAGDTPNVPPLPMLVLLTAICSLLMACGASSSRLPSAADEARVGTYSKALGVCDAKLAADKLAAVADGGAVDRSALLASYATCAHAVDIAWGRVDAGGAQ